MELDKRFGFSKDFNGKLEMGDEVGRGHFGYTCSARYKKGTHKGQQVAVKVIPKSKVCPSNSFLLLFTRMFILFLTVFERSCTRAMAKF